LPGPQEVSDDGHDLVVGLGALLKGLNQIEQRRHARRRTATEPSRAEGVLPTAFDQTKRPNGATPSVARFIAKIPLFFGHGEVSCLSDAGFRPDVADAPRDRSFPGRATLATVSASNRRGGVSSDMKVRLLGLASAAT
jgi:hypothetical protein